LGIEDLFEVFGSYDVMGHAKEQRAAQNYGEDFDVFGSEGPVEFHMST
jgi:hypothetical protein